MRLEKIKLAGFKSFVDPMTVYFPSNLVGVVGPNGCGKSNVIDAVRWVMGESSAKMLRGQSMADVIFNGSSTRKPVGMASVELVFDNADGSAGGQYAQYSQISVKRQASRDGQSNYFLNGVRCRRRDITDLFLGTGLGPRSYSIIEQGMISRIIEARPEELRVYLEEAAGISKYKERRRETENRIKHTRENLERLDDLRDEVQKQLRHLERQAAVAEKYKVLKAEERRAKAELLTLKLADMADDIALRDKAIAAQETEMQAVISKQRETEAEIEQLRQSHNESNDKFNEVQGEYYAIGSDIARLEESIQYAKESRRQQEKEYEIAQKGLAEAQALSQQDRVRLEEVAADLERDEPQLEEMRMMVEEASMALTEIETQMHDWQAGWDSFNQRANEPQQTAQVERTRINHLEQQEQQLKRRLERLQEELSRLTDIELQAEIKELDRREQECRAQADHAKAEVESKSEQIGLAREDNKRNQDQLANARSEAQVMQGRLASLQALQQAALGKDDKDLTAWLNANNLNSAQRLVESISVDKAWQPAVERVLSKHLQALLVSDFEGLAQASSELKNANLNLFEDSSQTISPRAGSLAEKVQGPAQLTDILNAILIADDMPAAMAMRAKLQLGESILTKDGILLGRGWLSIQSQEESNSGMLAREQEIRELTQRHDTLMPMIEQLAEALEHGQVELADAERQKEEQQAQYDTINKTLSEIRASLSAKRARAEQIRSRVEGMEQDAQDMRMQIEEGAEQMEASRENLHMALEQVEELGIQREELMRGRENLREEQDSKRQAVGEIRAKEHEIALRVQSLRSSEASLRTGIDRMQSQLQQQTERCEQLQETLENALEPMALQQEQLEQKLVQRSEVEASLNQARKTLEAIDHRLRELEHGRHQIEQATQEQRNKLDNARMQRQEVIVRSRTLEEQLQETGMNQAELQEGMAHDATVGGWEDKISQLAGKIQRLGPINLAAIEEFKEQSERMEYLDKQHDDISSSLNTLEEAIRKIDRETRTRFKETFDKVDAGLKQLFPKLFGGGHAYLELTGDDLLDTGVAVMARPPGKRNTSIHLLSGGEKALSAVALVFSIFQLNPAPFCMLDEVDAPLDDANVGRYSRLVKEMSEHVQFIFITHNKVTMEIANQLSGVTMHEPGVSRLVSVDVEEAAALASI